MVKRMEFEIHNAELCNDCFFFMLSLTLLHRIDFSQYFILACHQAPTQTIHNNVRWHNQKHKNIDLILP